MVDVARRSWHLQSPFFAIIIANIISHWPLLVTFIYHFINWSNQFPLRRFAKVEMPQQSSIRRVLHRSCRRSVPQFAGTQPLETVATWWWVGTTDGAEQISNIEQPNWQPYLATVETLLHNQEWIAMMMTKLSISCLTWLFTFMKHNCCWRWKMFGRVPLNFLFHCWWSGLGIYRIIPLFGDEKLDCRLLALSCSKNPPPKSTTFNPQNRGKSWWNWTRHVWWMDDGRIGQSRNLDDWTRVQQLKLSK